MNKVKTMFKSIFDNLHKVWSRYPLTVCLIFAAALTGALFFDRQDTVSVFMAGKGFVFFLLWGVGTFTSETCFPGRKPLNWAFKILTGLSALVLVYFINIGSGQGKEFATHFAIAYAITMIVWGLYRNYQRSGNPFNQYCIQTVYHLSQLAIIAIIVMIGLALVIFIFVTLILNTSFFGLIFRVELLVMGCLIGWGTLSALINQTEDLPRFFTVIIKYLLMILLLAAFTIIYGYILKIIITGIVPSNEIFRILAGLFLLGLPIWTLVGTFDASDPLVRIGKKLPYVFIPFLFLQGYAIRKRINAFGMTPMRYLCLMLMLFEVLYIIVYRLRKYETGIMLPIIGLLAVISLIAPFVNMYSVSNRSQKAIFDRYTVVDFSELTVDEQSSLAGAYYYLDGNAEGTELLAQTDPDSIEKIKASGKIGVPDHDRNIYLFRTFSLQDTDISAYHKMTSVWIHEAENSGTVDLSAVSFCDSLENEVVTLDLRTFAEKCIEASENSEEPPETIQLDDGRLIQILDLNLIADQEHSVQHFNLTGILLE